MILSTLYSDQRLFRPMANGVRAWRLIPGGLACNISIQHTVFLGYTRWIVESFTRSAIVVESTSLFSYNGDVLTKLETSFLETRENL